MSFIAEIAGSILWWILLFPMVWVLATPVILIWAFFHSRPYLDAVKDMYGGVTDIWREWGLIIIP